MGEAVKKYAFPVAKVFGLGIDGTKQYLGVRFLWNTGESDIRWDTEAAPRNGRIVEEAFPNARGVTNPANVSGKPKLTETT